jgi:hypothetical protein
MHADAYGRARKLLGANSWVTVKAAVLGAIHSLLVLALLGVAGLLAALFATQGEARLPTTEFPKLPTWVGSRRTGFDEGLTVFNETGLFPIVSANLSSGNPLHRAGARLLMRVLQIVPTFINNFGALSSLLALAAGLILILCVLAQYRRSIIAEASCEVATALRRQIHRQM